MQTLDKVGILDLIRRIQEHPDRTTTTIVGLDIVSNRISVVVLGPEGGVVHQSTVKLHQAASRGGVRGAEDFARLTHDGIKHVLSVANKHAGPVVMSRASLVASSNAYQRVLGALQLQYWLWRKEPLLAIPLSVSRLDVLGDGLGTDAERLSDRGFEFDSHQSSAYLAAEWIRRLVAEHTEQP